MSINTIPKLFRLFRKNSDNTHFCLLCISFLKKDTLCQKESTGEEVAKKLEDFLEKNGFQIINNSLDRNDRNELVLHQSFGGACYVHLNVWAGQSKKLLEIIIDFIAKNNYLLAQNFKLMLAETKLIIYY